MTVTPHQVEAVATAGGLLYVWLLARGSGRGWPVGVLTAVLSGWVYWQQNIRGQFALNVFFFAMQLVGWYRWAKNTEQPDLRLSSRLLSGKERLLVLVAWILGSAALCLLLTEQGSRFAPPDAFATVGSLAGQALIVVGFAESWLIYLASDVVLVGLSIQADMRFYAFMYLVYCALAWNGWLEWTRDRREKARKVPAQTLESE